MPTTEFPPLWQLIISSGAILGLLAWIGWTGRPRKEPREQWIGFLVVAAGFTVTGTLLVNGKAMLGGDVTLAGLLVPVLLLPAVAALRWNLDGMCGLGVISGVGVVLLVEGIVDVLAGREHAHDPLETALLGVGLAAAGLGMYWLARRVERKSRAAQPLR